MMRPTKSFGASGFSTATGGAGDIAAAAELPAPGNAAMPVSAGTRGDAGGGAERSLVSCSAGRTATIATLSFDIKSAARSSMRSATALDSLGTSKSFANFAKRPM